MPVTFTDVQNMLDAVLANSTWAQSETPPLRPSPHSTFWRQTGDYDQDYTLFTTGTVPHVPGPLPIMNTAKGQELTSNFYVVLTDPNGLPGPGIEQMPGGEGGP